MLYFPENPGLTPYHKPIYRSFSHKNHQITGDFLLPDWSTGGNYHTRAVFTDPVVLISQFQAQPAAESSVPSTKLRFQYAPFGNQTWLEKTVKLEL